MGNLIRVSKTASACHDFGHALTVVVMIQVKWRSCQFPGKRLVRCCLSLPVNSPRPAYLDEFDVEKAGNFSVL